MRKIGPAQPLAVRCEACGAKVGVPCSRPTNQARAWVTWFHADREARCAELNAQEEVSGRADRVS